MENGKYFIKIGIGAYSDYYEEWYYSNIPISEKDLETAFEAVKLEIEKRREIAENKIEENIRKKYGDEIYEIYRDFGTYLTYYRNSNKVRFKEIKEKLLKYSLDTLNNIESDVAKINDDVLYSWKIDGWVGCAKKLGYLKSLKKLNPDVEYSNLYYI